MSYILDALQRADAERTRGGVPTLHARPIASPPAKSGLNTRQRAGLAIAVALVLVAAAVAWWVWRPAPQQPAVVVVASPPVAQAAPVVTPPVVLPLPSPVNVPTRVVAAVTAPPAPQPTPTPAVTAKPANSASATEPAVAAPPKTKAVAVAPAAVDTPAPTPTLAALLSDLPEATRRQIPTMAISGAVYSENPAQRLLLVNGQVLNQGSQVAPDLTVVEIHSNNSEFNFRGTRFRMVH